MQKFAEKRKSVRNQNNIRMAGKTRTVTFIEIYFKGDKSKEDRNRLKTFLDRLKKEEK